MDAGQEARRSRDLRILKRLRPYVQQHAGLLVLAGLTLPLLAAAQLAAPYLLRLAIDRHVTPAATGDAAALDGAKALAMTALDFLSDPDLRERTRNIFEDFSE